MKTRLEVANALLEEILELGTEDMDCVQNAHDLLKDFEALTEEEQDADIEELTAIRDMLSEEV